MAFKLKVVEEYVHRYFKISKIFSLRNMCDILHYFYFLTKDFFSI